MGRGLFGGIVWGIVVTGLVLVVAVLVVPPPAGTRPSGPDAPAMPGLASRPEAPPSQTLAPADMPEPLPRPVLDRPAIVAAPGTAPATDIELPPGSEFNRRPPDQEASLPETDTGLPGAPPVRGPEPGGAPVEAPQLDTAPIAAPAPVTTGPDGLAPPLSAEAPPDLAADEPVLPSPAATGPVALRPTPLPAAPSREAAADGPAAEGAAIPAEPEDRVAAERPAPAETEAAIAAQAPEAALPRVRPLPAAPEAPAEGSGMAAMPETAPVGALRLPAPEGGIALPGPRIGQPAAQAPEPEAPAEDVAEVPTAAPREGLGALARNAVAFQPAPGRPLFSVILIDAGEQGLERAALTTFSFPVTFAVDPARPDAEEAIAAYRAAGYEVVVLATGLPPGATPADLEVTLAAHQAPLERAVAVMDVAGAGFQDDRALTAQMVAFAGETGHGLVSYDRGLNSAARLAGQAGVPQATVFRLIDEARPNAPTIRRMLDRAVFKARQDGHVVMVGHSYADTVTALYSWALEAEAQAVTLAPISAVLRRR
ncbi:divergent polysaccharide deacetylase family protein [Rhodovulum strictum]|uniref:Divergent polysaccharide deacetylase n=1 Tax=Rhodovulum strictum TaxID=58314 RepID=A0A844B1P7_9RHOB|nr:divergent polysaccharide deacetylase family protein [Rhodovulum strictum]MRH20286.1 hypothetical protein [Rhodovulum strictum]